LIGERMMPGFFIALSMRLLVQRAIFSGSKPSNSSRMVSRLRRMVIQESPAWCPSSWNFSHRARLSRSGTPHSSS